MIRELNKMEMQEIYETRMVKDFPAAELKPWRRIEEMMGRKAYFAYACYEEEELMAYAFFASAPDRRYILLDYYAVSEASRGTGVGSRFLKLWKEALKESQGVFAEVENPEFAQSAIEKEVQERRIRFYQNNGLIDTQIRTCVFQVEYRILYLPIQEMGEKEMLTEQLSRIYHVMFSDKTYEKEVRIHKELLY